MNRLISGFRKIHSPLKDGVLMAHEEGGKPELGPGVGGAGFYE